MPRNRRRHLTQGEFRLRVYLGAFLVFFVVTTIWAMANG